MTRIERARKWIDAVNRDKGLRWMEMADGQFHSHTVKITADNNTLTIGESTAFYCIDVWDNSYEAFIEIYDDNQEVIEQIEDFFGSIDDAENWCNEHALKQDNVSFVWFIDCGNITEGGLLKYRVLNNPKKKLEKPENMAIEGTARIATVMTEPNFMAGAIAESMTIDSIRVGDGYNFDEVSVSDIDANKMRNLVKK